MAAAAYGGGGERLAAGARKAAAKKAAGGESGSCWHSAIFLSLRYRVAIATHRSNMPLVSAGARDIAA